MANNVHPKKLDFWCNHEISGDNNSRGVPDQAPAASITVEQAAAYLHCCQQTIRRYIRDGRLIAWDLGSYYRIPLQEWESFLDSMLNIEVHREYISISEVMRLLDITRQQISELMSSGDIPYYDVGGIIRIKRSDLSEWISSKKRRGANPANVC